MEGNPPLDPRMSTESEVFNFFDCETEIESRCVDGYGNWSGPTTHKPHEVITKRIVLGVCSVGQRIHFAQCGVRTFEEIRKDCEFVPDVEIFEVVVLLFELETFDLEVVVNDDGNENKGEEGMEEGMT
jgi:hypothetical protein